MSSAAIHISRKDVPVARVNEMSIQPRYSYIVVDVAEAGDITLFLPDGPAGPTYARALAAELLKVADAYDALAATFPVEPEVSHV